MHANLNQGASTRELKAIREMKDQVEIKDRQIAHLEHLLQEKESQVQTYETERTNQLWALQKDMQLKDQ